MSGVNSTLPEIRRPVLAALLRQPRMLRAIECHDPLSALLGERACATAGGAVREFDLLWASGFGHATAMGLPDAGIATLERRLDTITDIAAMTSKPIIADGDTGGDALAFSYLCRRLEQIGVSAVVVEDKVGAKRTSLAHDVSHELENPQTFVAKIDSARERLTSGDFLIMARLESLIAGAGLDDAIARARLYLRSSAAGLVIHSKDPTGHEVLAFMRGYRRLQEELGIHKPLVCIPTVYNHLTAAELFSHGARMIIHGNHMIRAAFSGMQKAAQSILQHDRSLEADEICAPVAELFAAVGVGA
jgi:2-methylisocitrate lyase-like PEP mutase family enzyme